MDRKTNSDWSSTAVASPIDACQTFAVASPADACQTFASESSVTGFYVAPFLKKFQRRESDQTRSWQWQWQWHQLGQV